jgi:hypothetical protein
MPLAQPFFRPRVPFVVLALLTIPCGLALRHTSLSLPRAVTKEGADALYATLVYFLARIAWPAPARRMRAVLAAVIFCFGVETAQLYQAPWLTEIRNTTLGGLVLGHGFHAADLLAYVVGIGLGVLIERATQRLG